MKLARLGLALLVALAPIAAHAKRPSVGAEDVQARQVDRLFAPWTGPDKPGATLAVIRDGRIIYARGYGMADIERSMPNSPDTVFHIASMSKQFTAFAVLLLAHEGKLSLGDDVRKYLPELHDFGQTITIADLLHHTSGLRDQWALWRLSGHRIDDQITEDDLLRLIWRQRALNFPPGSKFLYSNTGYNLLAQIVARVSGQPFDAFLRTHIFQPLGMSQTHVNTAYGDLTLRRASSYIKGDDGKYQYVALSYSNWGATSLFTTVGDFARWDANFYHPTVGDASVIADMQRPGRLSDGKPITYAAGLEIDRYRGLTTVEHSGGDAGFRTDALRFPDQHLTVVIFANAGDLDTTDLARKIADIYLARELGSVERPPPAPQPQPTITLSATQMVALAGDYEVTGPDFVVRFTPGDGQMSMSADGDPPERTHAISPRALVVDEATFVFDAPGPDGAIAQGVLHDHQETSPVRRVSHAPLPAADIAARDGAYYSQELDALYRVFDKDGALWIRGPHGETPLSRGAGDDWFADFGRITFKCAAADRCQGLSLTSGRVSDLQFDKVSLEPLGK